MKLQYLALVLCACAPKPAPTPPAPSVAVVTDDFTAPAGSDLSTHTTNTGQRWAPHTESDPLVINADGRVGATKITSAGAVYWLQWTPPEPNYTIRAEVIVTNTQESGAEAALLAARGDLDNGVALGFRVFEGTYQVTMATTGNAIHSEPAPVELGVYHLTLRFAGDTAFGWVGATQLKLPLTPETAKPGAVGLFGYLEAPPINGGLQFDNYEIELP